MKRGDTRASFVIDDDYLKRLNDLNEQFIESIMYLRDKFSEKNDIDDIN